MDKNVNNDLLILGICILGLGLALAAYSISTYTEIKNLSQKVDFELVDGNIQLSSSDKYYKYLSFADFLNQKLEQNKNIPIKNASCAYLDFAQHNAIELYRLTSRKMDLDESKKNVAAGNVRALYNMLDNYRTCKQTNEYKTELNNILNEIQESESLQLNRQQRMNEFYNNYKDRYTKQAQQEEAGIAADSEYPVKQTMPEEQDIQPLQNPEVLDIQQEK